MTDTTLRYLTMLQAIPRYPRSISTVGLQKVLQEHQYQINIRSIQRDLEKLSLSFPIIADENSRPFKWSFDSKASIRLFPALDLPSAITLELARAYLKPLLPPDVLAYLKPYFNQAEQVLKQNKAPISEWPNKIRFLSRGFIGTRPKLKANCLEKITQAIIEGHKCKLKYHGRRWDKAQDITVEPLGLVFRDPNTYLIASIDGREGVRQLALHRIVATELLESHCTQKFDLDAFIASGEMHVLHSKEKIQLRLLCDNPEMSHLIETPLDLSQTIHEQTPENFVINVALADSSDLRWWLLAQASHLTILEPEWLRGEICSTLKTSISRQSSI